MSNDRCEVTIYSSGCGRFGQLWLCIMTEFTTVPDFITLVHRPREWVRTAKSNTSVVRTTNGDTDWFKIERGVRQGCVISPVLYNIYSEHIMRCVLEEHHDGITIGGRRETNLRFADDTTLLCTSKEELLGLLKKVKEASMSKNLLLNTQKTKIMVVDKDRERKEDFVLDGEKIKKWKVLST